MDKKLFGFVAGITLTGVVLAFDKVRTGCVKSFRFLTKRCTSCSGKIVREEDSGDFPRFFCKQCGKEQ